MSDGVSHGVSPGPECPKSVRDAIGQVLGHRWPSTGMGSTRPLTRTKKSPEKEDSYGLWAPQPLGPEVEQAQKEIRRLLLSNCLLSRESWVDFFLRICLGIWH